MIMFWQTVIYKVYCHFCVIDFLDTTDHFYPNICRSVGISKLTLYGKKREQLQITTSEGKSDMCHSVRMVVTGHMTTR